MKERHVLVWLAQGVFFLAGGVGFLFTPGLTMDLITDPAALPTAWRPQVVAAFHMIGPFPVTMGLLTFVALLRADPRTMRGFARAFTFFIAAWSFVFWFNYASGRYTWPALGFAVPGLGFLLYDAWLGLRVDPDANRQSSTGFSGSRPPELWGLWMLQALFFGGIGLAFFLGPAFTMQVITLDGVHEGALPAVLVDQFRMVSPYYFGMAVFSLFGAWRHDVAVWRELALVFALAEAMWLVVFVWIFDSATYPMSLCLMMVPAAFFMVGNIRAVWDDPVLLRQDLQSPPSGWALIDVPAGAVMGVQTWSTRKRASHGYGVGVGGRFVPAASEGVPFHPFFCATEGSTLPEMSLRARFANLGNEDDAGLDVRGAAIQVIGDAGQFDMVMNTGSFTSPRNILQFTKLAAGKWFPPSFAGRALQKDRQLYEGAVAGMRRAPKSYGALSYYSQITRFWHDEKGNRYLVRYRLLPPAQASAGPAADNADDPLLDEADLAHPWLRERRSTCGLAPNYLRAGLAEAVTAGEVRMTFQAQYHRSPADNGSLAWYDATVDWFEDDCPWHTLGTVVLDRTLSDDETERLGFDPNLHPVGLGIPAARGFRDPRSLGDAEARVMAALRVMRQWRNRSVPTGGDQ